VVKACAENDIRHLSSGEGTTGRQKAGNAFPFFFGACVAGLNNDAEKIESLEIGSSEHPAIG
jgi:hypothetical protein